MNLNSIIINDILTKGKCLIDHNGGTDHSSEIFSSCKVFHISENLLTCLDWNEIDTLTLLHQANTYRRESLAVKQFSYTYENGLLTVEIISQIG